jgi:hypothetical protein
MSASKDRDQAKQVLQEFLTSVAVPPDLHVGVSEACVDQFMTVEWPQPAPGTLGYLSPRYRWVIRSDDLKACDAFWKGLASAASVNFFMGSVSAAAIVGIIGAVFSVFYSARRKGAKLTPEQCEMLIFLKQCEEPVGEIDIAKKMADQNREWTADRISTVLKSLEKVRAHDGTVMAVVARDSEDKWAVAAI